MAYMLDTNIVSYILKASASAKLMYHLAECEKNKDAIFISSITYAEILHGIEKVGRPQRLIDGLNYFLRMCQILDWDELCAKSYAELRIKLNQKGITVDSMDLMIGSHAHAQNLTLISNDHIFNHFKQFSVSVENWQN